MGVLLTAEFAALAAIDAGLPSFDPSKIGLAGNEVGLPGQRRDPEGVDHVSGGELHLNRLANGNMNLVGGSEDARGLVASDSVPATTIDGLSLQRSMPAFPGAVPPRPRVTMVHTAEPNSTSAEIAVPT